ncbi:MAG: hypothetical protein ABI995_14885 [Acidobacteriota bacterium]
MDRSLVTVTTTWLPNNTVGSAVEVQVAYVFSPMLNLVFNGNMTMKSTSRRYISH